MIPIRITDSFFITGQIRAADMPQLAAMGFVAILNNRPDGEEADQPDHETMRQAAAAVGMGYLWLPVTGSTINGEVAETFRSMLDAASGPVLAHCRSGARSFTLWAIGEVLVGRMNSEDLAGFALARGCDASAALNWLSHDAQARGQTLLRKEPQMSSKPEVTGFFDPRTWSVQYVVADPATKDCAIIDPVYDYDEKSGQTGTQHADEILRFVSDRGYRVQWILDTHPHADHFSAAHYLKEKTGAPTAIGEKVVEVQKLWKGFYNWPDFPEDGRQWDRLFADGDTFMVGTIPARVMFSPGHTLASITYVIGDAAFVHDTLFQPDSGTARADFPGGNANVLWDSIQAILALPDETRIFTGHDYQPGGREPQWESTVAEQKAGNIHIAKYRTEAEFVTARDARDATLPMPKLILHALQVNMNGGRLPEPESNGRRYIKLPLDVLTGADWG